MEVRVYETEEIAVEWRAERCEHSGNCFRNLPKVFNPRVRPWIQLEHASSDDVARAVSKCPSGALKLVDKRT